MNFKKTKRQIPQTLGEFPQGTYLKTENGYFFVVSPTKRYRFISKRVLDSWAPHRVVDASESHPAVEKLRVIAKMKFRNGSLLYSHSNGKMYLVSDNKIRHITNPYILPQLGLRLQDAVWITQDETKLHEEGDPLK